MDFIGNSLKPINTGSNYKNLNPIDLVYQTQEEYCESTSKVINALNSSCRVGLLDSDSKKYVVEILDCRYDTSENRITIYPESCRKFKPNNKK